MMKRQVLYGVSLVVLVGCPYDPAEPDARNDACRPEASLPEDGGVSDLSLDDLPVHPDIAALPQVVAAPDRLTLTTLHSCRRVALVGDAVTAVNSNNTIVSASVDNSAALVCALAEGNSNVTLIGTESAAQVDVQVVLETSAFAVAIHDLTYGTGAGFGQANMPEVVFGPPQGRGLSAGSLDVVSLGLGGVITLDLGFDVVDGPGFDLIVFENAFSTFPEAGQVSVSSDGLTFVDFACETTAPYLGCAGITPVYSHPDNSIDPLDPSVAGGDAFDLAELAVDRVRYVRITDVGGVDTGGGLAGFDLDAVVAIHSAPPQGSLLTPDQLTVGLSDQTALRVDLQATPFLHGVRVNCSVEPSGQVEFANDCTVVTGLVVGHAQITVWLGDMETTLPVEVIE